MKRALLALAVLAACFGLVRADVSPRPGRLQIAPMQFRPLTLDDGLIAYYKMEEASGNLVDSIGGRNMVPYGTPVYQVAGKNNYGIEFATIEDFHMFPGTFPNHRLPHSYSVWTKFSGTEGVMSAIAGSTYGSPVLTIGRQGSAFGIYLNGSTFYAGASGRTPGTWYNLSYTFNGSLVHRLYVDGQFDVQYLGVGANATDFFIAQTAGTTTNTIDEIRFANRCWQQSDIDAIYNGGAGTFYP